MKSRKIIRRMHSLFGLIIVIQALIWSLSGLIMVLLPEADVEGSIYLAESSAELEKDRHDVWSKAGTIVEELQSKGQNPTGLRIRELAGQTILEVVFSQAKVALYDLESEMPLQIDEELVSKVASSALKDHSDVLFVALVESGGREYHGPFPVWKVITANKVRSHLYLSPQTLQILAHRTKFWRWHRYSYDLHTFNFSGASSVNNPLLAGLALLMLLLALSGAALLPYVFLKRQKCQ